MCLYPKFILNRKYRPNKKNGGNPPPLLDLRTKYVPIGCGKCMECKKQRANTWRIRLMEELRVNKSGKFVTMTFSDEELNKLETEIHKETNLTGYDLENEVATVAIRRFLERWRKKFGTSVRHWLVTELGQEKTERLHIHGIIWSTAINQKTNMKETVKKSVLEKLWKYGNVNKRDKEWENNYCSERTINYIVKYVNKTDELHKYYNPKILCSAGIGNNYTNRPDSKQNKFNGTNTKETYYTRQGYKLGLPIYYRNKIYSEKEREQLWLNRLDKQERWVNGIKVDISKNEDDYWKLVKYFRTENKRLGYGDDSKNWDKIKYEQDRRNLKRLQRQYKLHKNNKEDVYRNPLVAVKEDYLRVKATAKKIIDYDTGEIYEQI